MWAMVGSCTGATKSHREVRPRPLSFFSSSGIAIVLSDSIATIRQARINRDFRRGEDARDEERYNADEIERGNGREANTTRLAERPVLRHLLERDEPAVPDASAVLERHSRVERTHASGFEQSIGGGRRPLFACLYWAVYSGSVPSLNKAIVVPSLPRSQVAARREGVSP